MPSLGAEMESGRLLTWYVEAGQQVHRGDVIAEVETDKADIDVEVFEDGTVGALLVEEGTRVPVGTPMATILPAGAVVPDGLDRAAPQTPTSAASRSADVVVSPAVHPGDAPVATAPASAAVPVVAEPVAPVPEPAGPTAPLLNPVLRRLAQRLEVDTSHLAGTGPGGRVTRADVERAAATEARPSESSLSAPPTAASSTAAPPTSSAAPSGRASPYARRLAAERGIALASRTGSGPGGALVAADLAAIAEPDASPQPVTDAEDRGGAAEREDRDVVMRRAIARAMSRSKREIPHYYLGETVDVEPMMRWLEDHNETRSAAERLLPAVLLLAAVARTAATFPELNGTWEDDRFRAAEGVHLGVAISLRGGGLLAPVIRDAHERSLQDLMAALRDLVGRTRRGGLRASELTGGSISLSNLGDTGVETVLAVIQPPQVALVGAGSIAQRPWVEDGQVVVRRCLHLTLAADHRASDGHLGGRFLAAIADHLRRPEQL
jgi:pyruvate dehydrogenase E2 component (dihydrolipoamide acetyltransferase)